MRITNMTIKEKFIEELWNDRNNQVEEKKFTKQMQKNLDEYVRFLQIDDMYRKTNNIDIVELLYFTKVKISLTEICQKLFLDEKTLYRYRIKYMKLFDIIVSFNINDDRSVNFCPIKKGTMML